nr:MAG TPA: hypothetical protein [Caudoviricetes sp.]
MVKAVLNVNNHKISCKFEFIVARRRATFALCGGISERGRQ